MFTQFTCSVALICLKCIMTFILNKNRVSSRFRFDFNIDYDLLVLFYYLYNVISSHLGRCVIRRGVHVWSSGIAVHGALAVSMGCDPLR